VPVVNPRIASSVQIIAAFDRVVGHSESRAPLVVEDEMLEVNPIKNQIQKTVRLRIVDKSGRGHRAV